MIVAFEIGGMLALLAVVWVIHKAARARPEERGLKVAAWLAFGVWLAFAATLLADDLAESDGWQLARNALIAAVIIAVVMGYRRLIGILRERAGRE